MPGTRGTYRRVLLKLSGEVFGGAKGIGVDPDVVQDIPKQIADVARSGVQVAIIVGVIIVIPALRIRGVQLGVVTIAASVTIQNLFFNNENLTGLMGGVNQIAPLPLQCKCRFRFWVN